MSTHKLPWQVHLQPDVRSFSSLISACGEGHKLYPAPTTISSQCLEALGRFTVAASGRSSAPWLIVGGKAVASTLVIAYDKIDKIGKSERTE